MQNDNVKLKILILGGGFGGVRAALNLEKKLKDKVEITLIDKNSYHLFAPALYEVASAYGVKKDPFAVRLKKTICIPYSDIFSGKKMNFIQAEISSIDLENKKVATRGGEILDYDYLVIALGGQAADLGVPGVKEYAYRFKNLEDALLLNRKIEELTQEVAAGRRTQPIKIAVVGAGFTGIEVAAEFACCVKTPDSPALRLPPSLPVV
ncbi:MAG: FAD-dependent oxidoreductase [Candidatus Yanofskybacteria bacterium]|nr:FAD-dependent oxidoreductase [Candidatus Yanofskybacteria bacterium]